MANKQIRDTLNDGFALYGTKVTQRSERGKRIGDNFVQQGNLAYREMSCRDEDYNLAKVMSKVLNLKIKTHYPPSMRNVNKSKLTFIVNAVEYDVIKCDVDREKNYLYFYLQEVGAFEQSGSVHAETD